MTKKQIYIGNTQLKHRSKTVNLESVIIDGEEFNKISNSDLLRPFFMSIVSDSNHWMFISSNGSLTAGRKDADHSLFPYYTDDKITESSELTGSKTILQVHRNDKKYIWEPMSAYTFKLYNASRNLYKSIYGNKIIFEEINHDLKLVYRCEWNSSNVFGFVKRVTLSNTGSEKIKVSVLDGLQNILPHGVNGHLQDVRSNLVDAYKRSELIEDVGLGIYGLSAIIVDRAEPSEALKANTVWSMGMKNPKYLLSSLQLNAFRRGENVQQETDIKAEKGAYFVNSELALSGGSDHQWLLIANVNQGPSSVVALAEMIRKDKDILRKINADIALGTQQLLELVSSSDGLQLSADKRKNDRHYSNVLFNIMRGGIFDEDYKIEKWDFLNYLYNANETVSANQEAILSVLADEFNVQELLAIARQSNDMDFSRLCFEYMPLKFSRRHGDPSRPWNRFTINTRSEIDGSKILDYEGNWRDIFQNWEALAHSYPLFIESMIHKFLNATTFDGYNPYRVTKDGFDWEVIEEHDPWSYIGYWGDHQIIYLLKFLEFIEDYYPGRLSDYFEQDVFVYANVPYKIKSYEEILKSPKDTIVFDYDLDHSIRENREKLGADGALLQDSEANIYKVNFIEKILATVLAKLSNFIPEGGIWMNTQRPEWNDANNALVGNGVSMVTLCYLRRFLAFIERVISDSEVAEITVSEELVDFLEAIITTLDTNKEHLEESISNNTRRTILDGLGHAGSNYRSTIYKRGFSGSKVSLNIEKVSRLNQIASEYLEHSIRSNRRKDGLYHGYNIMTVEKDGGVAISNLYEMLEGQVGVLSAGYLSPEECLSVLDAMKTSDLYRADQQSYMLYPNKALPGFSKKNNIPKNAVEKSKLLTKLIRDGHTRLIEKDVLGNYHFNGNFNNAMSLEKALSELDQEKYGALISTEKDLVLGVFEQVFDHKSFTGRSGTFYGYEGLGSIYWHMVSKLVLAISENFEWAEQSGADAKTLDRLKAHFHEANDGIGVHKSPESYGAFPTDPYSHTPFTKGAQQPGMTGQVKEDILSRMGELGIFVTKGKLGFNPLLLPDDEFLNEPATFRYLNVDNKAQEIDLGANSLCFTYCQVPVLYQLSEQKGVQVKLNDGTTRDFTGTQLDAEISNNIFRRSGLVDHITVFLNKE